MDGNVIPKSDSEFHAYAIIRRILKSAFQVPF